MRQKNKSEIIREIVSRDYGATNSQIKELARATYGVELETNLIIGIAGSFRDRVAVAGYQTHLLDAARSYLKKIGDKRLARELLSIVAEK